MKKLLFLFIALTSLNLKAQRNDSVTLAYLDSINYYIDSLDIQEPLYVLSQACWETGWFNCKNCTWENNNMFGFRGKSGKYMKFKNWPECVVYYANWQKKRYPKFKELHPGGTYLGFLKWCRFAESPHYSRVITETHNWVLKNWANN